MALVCNLSSPLVFAKMLALSASFFFLFWPVAASAQSDSTTRSVELQAGIKLVEQRRDSEAVDVLKRATSKNKADAEAWFYLGIAYVHLLHIKEATESFETAIELKPDYADSHLALADAYLRQSRLAQASAEADTVLALRPNDPYAHYSLAFVSFRRGLLDDVIKHAELAIDEKPDFAGAYLLKAQALLSTYPSMAAVDEEAKKQNRARYLSAAEPLRKYVELVSESENTLVWRDQIEVLTNFASVIEGNDVHTGKDVTTKARVTSKPEPFYSEQARQYQVTGTVILKAVFGSDAKVKHIQIVQALPAGLTEQSVKAARRITFIPATLDGQPVSMWMQLEYNFNLY